MNYELCVHSEKSLWSAIIRNDHPSVASRRDASLGSNTKPTNMLSHLGEMRPFLLW